MSKTYQWIFLSLSIQNRTFILSKFQTLFDGWSQYDVFDEIVVKIDDLMNQLANAGFENQVCDFLEEFILNSDDESVLDLFTDTYSRYRSVEKLFDENM